MAKIKKYVLTPTGEVRPPKCYEYYLGLKEYPDLATFDFQNYFPILKLEVIEGEWKPKMNEEYWYIDFEIMGIEKDAWDCVICDDTRYDIGNCFSTKEEAEQKLIKIKELLKQ